MHAHYGLLYFFAPHSHGGAPSRERLRPGVTTHYKDTATMARELDALFHDLSEQGFGVSDSLLPTALIDALYEEGLQSWRGGNFYEARVGAAHQPQRVTGIRGDAIQWLEPGLKAPAQQGFIDWTEALRHRLNREFFLGLQRSEFHFARYGEGQGYARHIDQHRNQPHRRITLIVYLTPNRQPDDGGELCLFHPDDASREWLRITPERGRVVLFRSELLPHAVLPTRRPRWSVTGWFRDDVEPQGFMGIAA